jgi:hypothetical protein
MNLPAAKAVLQAMSSDNGMVADPGDKAQKSS